MSEVRDNSTQVGIFDLVPWEIGRVHTGALALLLGRDDETGAAVRSLFDWDGVCELNEPKLEHREPGWGGRRRADLAIPSASIAIETKVNDAFRWDQLLAYEEAEGWRGWLFAPGLSGWLSEPNFADQPERIVTGEKLLKKVDASANLPDLLSQYMERVRCEVCTFEKTRCKIAAGQEIEFAAGQEIEKGDPGWGVAGVAWLRCVWDGVASKAKKSEIECYFRDMPYDWGVWLGPNRRFESGRLESEVFVDLRVSHSKNERSIRIVVEGESPDARREAYEGLSQLRLDGDWRPCQRRFTGKTVSVWKQAGALSMEQAVESVLYARDLVIEHTVPKD